MAAEGRSHLALLVFNLKYVVDFQSIFHNIFKECVFSSEDKHIIKWKNVEF